MKLSRKLYACSAFLSAIPVVVTYFTNRPPSHPVGSTPPLPVLHAARYIVMKNSPLLTTSVHCNLSIVRLFPHVDCKTIELNEIVATDNNLKKGYQRLCIKFVSEQTTNAV